MYEHSFMWILCFYKLVDHFKVLLSRKVEYKLIKQIYYFQKTLLPTYVV